MPELIAGADITAFFASGFAHTAWRWETRREYGVPSATADFRRFLRGEPAPPETAADPWRGTMRLLQEKGKSVARARVLDEPPTDYQRWLLEDVLDSVETGEDIRYLTAPQPSNCPCPWTTSGSSIPAPSASSTTTATLPSAWRCALAPTRLPAACRIRDAAWPHARPAEAVVWQAHPTL